MASAANQLQSALMSTNDLTEMVDFYGSEIRDDNGCIMGTVDFRVDVIDNPMKPQNTSSTK
ncbi:hypothetical protein BGZ76_003556, partial [Entomortierella beljakovae]